MRRSIKAAGFTELASGVWFHRETGAYGKLLKRSFRICRSRPRTRNGRDCCNRTARKPLEEVWQVTPGTGMAKLIRSLVHDALPRGTKGVDADLLEKMSSLLTCGGINRADRNRARGGVKRSRPSLKLLLGWAPDSPRPTDARKWIGR